LPPSPPLFPYTTLFRSVGTDALRHEVGVVVGGGVGEHRTAVGAHRHARHRLDATADDEVVPTRTNLLRSLVDRLQTRGAEPVERSEEHTSELQSRENLV